MYYSYKPGKVLSLLQTGIAPMDNIKKTLMNNVKSAYWDKSKHIFSPPYKVMSHY